MDNTHYLPLTRKIVQPNFLPLESFVLAHVGCALGASGGSDLPNQPAILTPSEEFRGLKPEQPKPENGKPAVSDCWRTSSQGRWAGS